MTLVMPHLPTSPSASITVLLAIRARDMRPHRRLRRAPGEGETGRARGRAVRQPESRRRRQPRIDRWDRQFCVRAQLHQRQPEAAQRHVHPTCRGYLQQVSIDLLIQFCPSSPYSNVITFVQFCTAPRLLAQDCQIRRHLDRPELVLDLRKRRQKVQQADCCRAHQVLRYLELYSHNRSFIRHVPVYNITMGTVRIILSFPHFLFRFQTAANR